MIDFEKLVTINQKLETVEVKKGADYVMVHERVKGFRELCPEGSITSEIVKLEDGVCTIKATVADENGNVLGTGLAQEKETSTFVNKTSFVENCETSAVGRALGFAGIGIDRSMASAEEVANAIKNQDVSGLVSDVDVARMKETLTEDQVEIVLAHYKVSDLSKLNKKQYANVFKNLAKKEAPNG